MSVPQGFTPCSVSGQYVDGFWEMAFVLHEQPERTIRLRVGAEDIDALLKVVSEGRDLLKYQNLVKGQESLLRKRRRRFRADALNRA